jgi:hypothetical protein
MPAPSRPLAALALVATVALSISARPAGGAVITIDENGHGDIDGVPLAYATSLAPGNYGGTPTLTYTVRLPPAQFMNIGTVGIHHLDGSLSDILIFDGYSSIWFFSDQDPESLGSPSLADVGTTGVNQYGSAVQVFEEGPEGDDGVFYTPGVSAPGYMSGVTFHIISDAVPEPGASLLAGVAAGALWIERRRGSAKAT